MICDCCGEENSKRTKQVLCKACREVFFQIYFEMTVRRNDLMKGFRNVKSAKASRARHNRYTSKIVSAPYIKGFVLLKTGISYRRNPKGDHVAHLRFPNNLDVKIPQDLEDQLEILEEQKEKGPIFSLKVKLKVK